MLFYFYCHKCYSIHSSKCWTKNFIKITSKNFTSHIYLSDVKTKFTKYSGKITIPFNTIKFLKKTIALCTKSTALLFSLLPHFSLWCWTKIHFEKNSRQHNTALCFDKNRSSLPFYLIPHISLNCALNKKTLLLTFIYYSWIMKINTAMIKYLHTKQLCSPLLYISTNLYIVWWSKILNK